MEQSQQFSCYVTWEAVVDGGGGGALGEIEVEPPTSRREAATWRGDDRSEVCGGGRGGGSGRVRAMAVRRAEFGTAGYAACLELRRVVLREPLGLGWSAADLEGEEEEWQMGIWDEEELQGCVSVRWLEAGSVKLRQMAVRADRQGLGIGRALLEGVMELLRGEGVERMELHSRENAVDFYRKMGFERVGERFEEVGLPHWRMKGRI